MIYIPYLVKRSHAVSLLLLPLLLAVGGCGKQESPEIPVDIDLSRAEDLFLGQGGSERDVVARVNNMDITEGEVLQILQAIQPPPGAGTPPVSQMRDYAVEQLVVRKLLLKEAQDAGFTATPDERQEAIAAYASRLGAGISLDDVLRISGLTQEQFQQDVEKEIIVKKLLQRVLDELPSPTEDEALAFYEENVEGFQNVETAHARHIFFSAPKGADEKLIEAKRTKAKQAQERLDKGASFEELVLQVSEDPNRAQGGQLPVIVKGQFSLPIEEAAFSLAPGEVSDVIQTPSGFHLLKLDQRAEPTDIPFDRAKDSILQSLQLRNRSTGVQDYISSLVESAEIERLR